MNIFKYIADKRYILTLFFLIMLFVNAVFYLDPKTGVSDSNLIYVDLFAFFIVLIYLSIDYLRVNAMLKDIRKQEVNLFHKISKSMDNEHRIYFDMIKNAYEKIENEKTLMKTEKKDYSEFIEKWVHEIKMPISVVRLIAEQDNELSEKCSHSINEEMKKISDNVDKALYYSKLDSFNQDYFIEQTDVYQIVKNVVKSNAALFIRKSIAINIAAQKLLVNTDKKWLHFIIYQIISNALKYTPPGGKITVSHVEEKNHFTLSISDTGCGIKNEDLSRIFNKGFTGYNGRQSISATGFGLYISNKLALKLGLKLSAESLWGEYTTLKIHFNKQHDYFNVTEM